MWQNPIMLRAHIWVPGRVDRLELHKSTLQITLRASWTALRNLKAMRSTICCKVQERLLHYLRVTNDVCDHHIFESRPQSLSSHKAVKSRRTAQSKRLVREHEKTRPSFGSGKCKNFWKFHQAQQARCLTRRTKLMKTGRKSAVNLPLQ